MANLTSLNKLPNTQKKRVFVAAENGLVAVPDPDLEISGGPVIQTLRLGGGGVGGGWSPKKFFVWSKNKGGPGPLLWIRHWVEVMKLVALFLLKTKTCDAKNF